MALHVGTNNLNFNHVGGTDNIGFYGDHPLQNVNVDIYSGTTSPSWAHLNWTYNAVNNSGVIEITVDVNNSEARSATIIINAREQVVNRDVTSIISINQTKGSLTGTVTVDGIYIDGVKLSQATMNNETHNLIIELKASATILFVEAINNSTWMSLIGYDITETSDINFNIHKYTFKVLENNTTNDRLTSIYFDVTDIFGIQRTNYLNLLVNQSYENAPYIFVEDIYTSSSSKRLNSIIDIRNIIIDTYTADVNWITNLQLDNNNLIYDVDENRTYETRTGIITITGTSTIDSHIIQFSFNIFQERAALTEELPIWKDYLIDIILTNNNTTDIYYNVLVNNNIIFTGHAYSYNNEVPQINITEIVRDYLIDNTNMLRKPLIYNVNNYIYVDVLSGESPSDITTTVATLRYYYDYTYTDNNIKIRNNSVTNEIDPRQKICFSFLNQSGLTNQIRVTNGAETHLFVPNIAGIWQYIDNVKGLGGTIQARFANETITYKIKQTCSKFCLYYLNLLGGWDSLLFEGQNRESEQYDYKLKTNDYLNTTIDFENQQYLKKIKNTYRLTTRYLTDEESQRMINVLRSPKAYLQNLETGKIFPVLINNKSTDIKTFKNQGKKMFTYTIELEESQQKFIKN